MSQGTKVGRAGQNVLEGFGVAYPSQGHRLPLLMGGLSPSFSLLALPGARQPAGDGISLQLPWK